MQVPTLITGYVLQFAAVLTMSMAAFTSWRVDGVVLQPVRMWDVVRIAGPRVGERPISVMRRQFVVDMVRFSALTTVTHLASVIATATMPYGRGVMLGYSMAQFPLQAFFMLAVVPRTILNLRQALTGSILPAVDAHEQGATSDGAKVKGHLPALSATAVAPNRPLSAAIASTHPLCFSPPSISSGPHSPHTREDAPLAAHHCATCARASIDAEFASCPICFPPARPSSEGRPIVHCTRTPPVNVNELSISAWPMVGAGGARLPLRVRTHTSSNASELELDLGTQDDPASDMIGRKTQLASSIKVVVEATPSIPSPARSVTGDGISLGDGENHKDAPPSMNVKADHDEDDYLIMSPATTSHFATATCAQPQRIDRTTFSSLPLVPPTAYSVPRTPLSGRFHNYHSVAQQNAQPPDDVHSPWRA